MEGQDQVRAPFTDHLLVADETGGSAVNIPLRGEGENSHAEPVSGKGAGEVRSSARPGSHGRQPRDSPKGADDELSIGPATVATDDDSHSSSR